MYWSDKEEDWGMSGEEDWGMSGDDDWGMTGEEDWGMSGDDDWGMSGDWNYSGDYNMSYDLNMTGDYNMSGNWTDSEWAYYSDDYMWSDDEVNWDEDINVEDGDWFGSLINPECQEDCNVSECDSGQACIVTVCFNPCTQETSCQQDYLQNWDMEWEEFDCSEGVIDIEPDCFEECEYTDCASDNNGETCWIEEC